MSRRANGGDPALFHVELSAPTTPRRSKRSTDPSIKRCIDLYHQAFTNRFGFKPHIHGGKDAAHVKALLGVWGEPVVTELIVEFLTTTDPRIVRSDYTLGALYSLAQYMRLKHARTDERTAINVDAAMRATAPALDTRRSR
jgi:hypothetical protein